ncbi:MAG: (Fe-S)-binding protein [Pyrobaculum sp.]
MEPTLDWVLQLKKLILSSIRERGLPLPVEREVCTKWREGLGGGGGRRVLYTSCMYQLAPFVKKAVDFLEKSGAHRGGLLGRVASLGASAAGWALIRPSREELERSSRILKSIYTLLKRSGVEVGLLDDEPYSGALLYELGFEKEFAEYAASVVKYFRERGVEEVVTVDPHTHYLLERVYPRYVELGVRVVNYLDLISPRGVKIRGFTIHDSCLYSRYLDKYQRVRQLLAPGGPIEDPYVTGRDTSGCCGGPVEAVAPTLAKKVAEMRVSKLSKLSKTVVVACPLCLVNLSRAGGVEVVDIAEVLDL